MRIRVKAIGDNEEINQDDEENELKAGAHLNKCLSNFQTTLLLHLM